MTIYLIPIIIFSIAFFVRCFSLGDTSYCIFFAVVIIISLLLMFLFPSAKSDSPFDTIYINGKAYVSVEQQAESNNVESDNAIHIGSLTLTW